MSAEEMHLLSPVLSKSVSIMIEKAPSLFAVPRELGDDVANFWREMEDPNVDVFTTDKENLDDHANIRKAKVNNPHSYILLCNIINTWKHFTPYSQFKSIHIFNVDST